MNEDKGVQSAIKSKEHFAQCIIEKERYFTSLENPSTKLYLEYYSIETIPQALFLFCFHLMEKNMRQMYLNSCDGWNKKFKLKEMKEPKTRFIIARSIVNEAPIAFISFQFDYEFEKEMELELNDSEDSYNERDDISFISQDLEDYREVVYCYEMQVERLYRNQGVGEFMMLNLFKIAKFWRIPYVLLTVFTNNQKATLFYKRLGFETDISSPNFHSSTFQSKKADYEILCKSINLKTITSSPEQCTKSSVKKQHTRNRSSISFKSLTW
ncbi:hypothetical protein K502DRAFT_328834 [Neoconidiobolus thromboides FSU 785]|nr:hypothetical protein K502DRAFT_328834 [Neoconidiobolus thromboides FSU 785]